MATETSQVVESARSPRHDRISLALLSPPPLLSPVRRASFTSPQKTGNNRPTTDVRAKSFHGNFSRGMFDVDGGHLPHWDKSNFQPERDESCRVIYKPKGGSEFYQKHLPRDDYLVMRRSMIEQPFFSKYNRFYPKKGHFCCKACGNPLYSHKAKLKREDGWPAFGACVDGAIGIITIEERKERQERERIAATRIQAFVRGCLTRTSISEKIALLIEKVTKLEEQLELEEEEINDLSDATKKRASRASIPLFTNLSLHSLDEFSFSDDDSSSSSFASFGDASYDDSVSVDKAKKSEQNKKTNGKSIASFAATAAVKRSQDKETKDAEANEWNELLIDIHCHRCKSHIGNIFEEENRGQDGVKKYKERHRVNGRSLKYVEDALPKRINADSSLLFANQSQRRLMGLKSAEPVAKEPEFLYAKPRTSFFVSPRAKRKKKIAESFQSPASRPKPGVGVRVVSFQSPVGSPVQGRRLSSKQKKLENMFLNRSVH